MVDEIHYILGIVTAPNEKVEVSNVVVREVVTKLANEIKRRAPVGRTYIQDYWPRSAVSVS
ncbi:MAG TPA: hypothetical protein VGR71_08200 [Nitrospira sp.]|nr:hypothetical protein [Nitrospira sp.]